MSKANARKRAVEQAARDQKIEAEFNDWLKAQPHQGPELAINNTSGTCFVTQGGVIAALRRRAAARGEEFIDPRKW